MRVAISGFGRIGKSFLKAAIEQDALGKEFQVVAINTRSPVEQHAHLFRYDSVYGRFKGKVEAKGGNLVINGHEIKWITETDPLKLPWKEMNVDLVLDSTGAFRSKADAERHIKAGAKMVLISAPADGVDATIVPGVNDHSISKAMSGLLARFMHHELPGPNPQDDRLEMGHRKRLPEHGPCLHE